MRLPLTGQAFTGLAALLAGVLLAGMEIARAASFQVNPVRISLSRQQPVASLVVSNTADQPVVLQLETVSWSQHDGKEHYQPTRELLATPPVFSVAPRSSQIVRVGLRQFPATTSELSYRLFLQEVLPEPEPDFQGMRVAVRVSVPVFVLPHDRAAPAAQWQAQRTASGQLKLTLTNNGDAHIKVARLTLNYNGLQKAYSQHIAEYVLVGQSRDWRFNLEPAPAIGTQLQLQVQTDDTRMEASVVVQ